MIMSNQNTMNSIGNKIQSSLIGSIIIVSVCALIAITVNQMNSYTSRQTISTMTMEYSIIDLSQNLAQTYNQVYKNPDNTQMEKEYTTLHAKLVLTLASLKKLITSRESALIFIGVENTVNQVLKVCDTGLLEIQNNNFQNGSTYYAEANKNNVFVRENTTSLIQKELERLSKTQKTAQLTNIFTFIASLIIFILVVIGVTIYSKSFSKQLILPLTKLSIFAKDVAEGKIDAINKESLETSNDEIGSLSKSIHTMVTNLINTVNQKQQANEEIIKANTSREQKTKELEEVNKLMVGREIKMSEMKKEIEELQKKLSNLHQ
jgi:methyl-accepting chemotaxis protein